eukprot:RCo019455
MPGKACPFTMAPLLAFLERLSIHGLSPTDSPDVRHQKKALALFLFLAGIVAPAYTLFLLLTDLRWAAACDLVTYLLPLYGTAAVFFGSPVVGPVKLRLCVLTVVVRGILSNVLVVLVSGGFRNSGYRVHMMSYPVFYLILTRDFRGTAGMLLGTVAAGAALLAVEPMLYHEVVEVWGVVPELSPAGQRWGWGLNILILSLGCTLLLLFLMVSCLDRQLRGYEAVERRLEELACRMVHLDLDEVEAPPDSASPAEKRLHDVVQVLRQWKPFVPATLFLREEPEGLEGPERTHSSSSGTSGSTC